MEKMDSVSITMLFILLFTPFQIAYDCPGGCECEEVLDNIIAKHDSYALKTTLRCINISQNYIPELTTNMFNGHYPSLEILVLKNNKIICIENNSFNVFRNLRKIDLSNNMLSSVSANWFLETDHLESINLSGNPIKVLQDFLFPVLLFLRDVNFEHCNIHTIHKKAFDNIPFLENINLMDNDLKSISTGVFEAIPLLKTINLNGNPWQCNNKLRHLLLYLKNHDLNVKYMLCIYGETKDAVLWDTMDAASLKTSREMEKYVVRKLKRIRRSSNQTLVTSQDSEVSSTQLYPSVELSITTSRWYYEMMHPSWKLYQSGSEPNTQKQPVKSVSSNETVASSQDSEVSSSTQLYPSVELSKTTSRWYYEMMHPSWILYQSGSEPNTQKQPVKSVSSNETLASSQDSEVTSSTQLYPSVELSGTTRRWYYEMMHPSWKNYQSDSGTNKRKKREIFISPNQTMTASQDSEVSSSTQLYPSVDLSRTTSRWYYEMMHPSWKLYQSGSEPNTQKQPVKSVSSNETLASSQDSEVTNSTQLYPSVDLSRTTSRWYYEMMHPSWKHYQSDSGPNKWKKREIFNSPNQTLTASQDSEVSSSTQLYPSVELSKTTSKWYYEMMHPSWKNYQSYNGPNTRKQPVNFIPVKTMEYEKDVIRSPWKNVEQIQVHSDDVEETESSKKQEKMRQVSPFTRFILMSNFVNKNTGNFNGILKDTGILNNISYTTASVVQIIDPNRTDVAVAMKQNGTEFDEEEEERHNNVLWGFISIELALLLILLYILYKLFMRARVDRTEPNVNMPLKSSNKARSYDSQAEYRRYSLSDDDYDNSRNDVRHDTESGYLSYQKIEEVQQELSYFRQYYGDRSRDSSDHEDLPGRIIPGDNKRTQEPRTLPRASRRLAKKSEDNDLSKSASTKTVRKPDSDDEKF